MMSVPREPNNLRPAFPLHVVWLATNACTARCLHCSSNAARSSVDELETAEVLDLLDQLAAAGVVDLAISGGEPLLRKDLFEIITHAHTRGLSVGLSTNGAKITPGIAKRLLDCGTSRLQVSLDGLAAAHDRLRCWPGLFRRALISIHHALNAGLPTHITCTVTRLNANELEAYAEFVSTLGVQRLNIARYIPTGRGDDALDFDDGQWRGIVQRCDNLRRHYRDTLAIVTHFAQDILVDPTVAELPGYIGCQAASAQGCITANGNVQPCALLPLSAGNIRDQSFREIWRDAPLLNRLRERDSLQGRCGSCHVQQRCGGCRALAYARNGDPLGEDPRCWIGAIPESLPIETALEESVHD